ncbi:hypothetical protein HK405_008003, partial [Cladochytrium tenue]
REGPAAESAPDNTQGVAEDSAAIPSLEEAADPSRQSDSHESATVTLAKQKSNTIVHDRDLQPAVTSPKPPHRSGTHSAVSKRPPAPSPSRTSKSGKPRTPGAATASAALRQELKSPTPQQQRAAQLRQRGTPQTYTAIRSKRIAMDGSQALPQRRRQPPLPKLPQLPKTPDPSLPPPSRSVRDAANANSPAVAPQKEDREAARDISPPARTRPINVPVQASGNRKASKMAPTKETVGILKNARGNPDPVFKQKEPKGDFVAVANAEVHPVPEWLSEEADKVGGSHRSVKSNSKKVTPGDAANAKQGSLEPELRLRSSSPRVLSRDASPKIDTAYTRTAAHRLPEEPENNKSDYPVRPLRPRSSSVPPGVPRRKRSHAAAAQRPRSSSEPFEGLTDGPFRLVDEFYLERSPSRRRAAPRGRLRRPAAWSPDSEESIEAIIYHPQRKRQPESRPSRREALRARSHGRVVDAHTDMRARPQIPYRGGAGLKPLHATVTATPHADLHTSLLSHTDKEAADALYAMGLPSPPPTARAAERLSQDAAVVWRVDPLRPARLEPPPPGARRPIPEHPEVREYAAPGWKNEGYPKADAGEMGTGGPSRDFGFDDYPARKSGGRRQSPGLLRQLESLGAIIIDEDDELMKYAWDREAGDEAVHNEFPANRRRVGDGRRLDYASFPPGVARGDTYAGAIPFATEDNSNPTDPSRRQQLRRPSERDLLALRHAVREAAPPATTTADEATQCDSPPPRPEPRYSDRVRAGVTASAAALGRREDAAENDAHGG